MMTQISSAVLDSALDFLTGLAADDVEPAAARERLDALRARHKDVRFRLVWRREEYDGSFQYDLLLTRAGREVVSLAYTPDRALPWSFRGGHRVSERLLLRVNDIPMEIDQAIAGLDFLWEEAPLTDRLVTACLLQQELEEAPVVLSAEELQAAMDAFRRARGLLTAAATDAWMARRGLSHSRLEQLVAAEAAVAALRRRETAGQIPAYFDAHRDALAIVRYSHLAFPTHEAALEAIRAIQAGVDFLAVAERSFAEWRLAPSTRLFCVARWDEIAEEIGGQIVAAAPGSTLGPFASDDDYAVVRVIAVDEAVLDAATAALIERRLFARWLEPRRQSARVEWFWGSAARTASLGDARRDRRAGSPS